MTDKTNRRFTHLIGQLSRLADDRNRESASDSYARIIRHLDAISDEWEGWTINEIMRGDHGNH